MNNVMKFQLLLWACCQNIERVVLYKRGRKLKLNLYYYGTKITNEIKTFHVECYCLSKMSLYFVRNTVLTLELHATLCNPVL